MPYILLLNHLSANANGTISDNANDGKSIFLQFYQAIKVAIESHNFEKFLVSDKDFWELVPSPDCNLTDFITSQSPTNQRFIYELNRLSKKTTTDFFSDELVERVTKFSPLIAGCSRPAEPLACAACVEDIIAISFATSDLWTRPILHLEWYEDGQLANPGEYDLTERVYNIFSPESIATTLSFFPQETVTYTREYWQATLPTVQILDSFWSWFENLENSVQKNFFTVVLKIKERNWSARKESSFQRLVGNELCEIRCWPQQGPTIRCYVKVESADCVVFLNGSGKKDQNHAIRHSIKLYEKYKMSEM